ncbi:MAG: cysteine--tRNA ligase [Planctomycetota bacterium]
MTLRLYNTLTRSKEEFVPLDGHTVKMYNCGPTVYTHAHIGNFRTFIFDDILRRCLEYRGWKVNQIMNITDVGHMTTDDDIEAGEGEDKLQQQARLEKKDPLQIARHYEKAFTEDFDLLGLKRPTAFPRATEHIPDMIEFVEKLIDKGYAYRVDDEVFFDLSRFKDYGKLSGNTLENLRAGHRVAVDERKRSPFDFYLWKSDPGHLMKWESPWGNHGFPGWHLECSVMSMKYLGETLDIHTGGEDNIFPHHEDEIAQSEALTGKPFARFWLHVRHLLVDGEKMSKSKGNFHTVRDLTEKGWRGNEIRYALMQGHYRQNINFTLQNLEDSRQAIRRLSDFIASMEEKGGPGTNGKTAELIQKAREEFEAAIDDDINIAGALGATFNVVREVNRLGDELSREEGTEAAACIRTFDKVFNVIPEEKAELEGEVEQLIKEREAARKAKDFKRADEIRMELTRRGIELEDTPQGTRWKKV